MPGRVPSLAAHLVAVALYAGLALALTWPLAVHLRDGMLGAGVGDNATFVWNFWWIRKAIATGQSPLWTPALFAPIGTSLVLHTTTLLPTIATTALLPQAEPLVTYNVAVIATVFLNGLCAYGAAYTLTRQPAAAIVAGLVFATSPFLTARLQGHFNVLSAWGLPLLVMAVTRYSRRASVANAIVLACALAALAYTDYYYFAFGLVLVALYRLLQDRRVDASSVPLTPARRRVLRALVVIMICLVAAMATIALSGGTELNVAGLQISARSTFNLRGALWLIGLIALLVWKSPRVRLARVEQLTAAAAPRDERHWHLRSLAAGATVLILLLMPLLVEAARMVAQDDYASQTYFWRSAPRGIDIGALLLGNPFHPLYGSWSRDLYARFDIHIVESVAWLGVVPIACLLFAFSRLRMQQPEVQRWLLLTGVFFVWALGPYLVTFGANSGFMLPQTLLRFVPVLANARIPGRAFVVVVLGAALITAFVLASNELSVGTRLRQPTLVVAAALLVLIDGWPGSQPLVPFDRPALYEALRSMPPGPVLDLPLGVRDGFGERGHLDHRALVYQTLHEHPIAGGFVARLSPRVRRIYEDDPVFSALLADGAPSSNGESLACAFRYVVLPKTSSAATRDVLNRVFRWERLDGDDARDLYRVTGCTMPRAR